MPFLSPINSIKALKDDSVPDWRQHAPMTGQEHCDGCAGIELPHPMASRKYHSSARAQKNAWNYTEFSKLVTCYFLNSIYMSLILLNLFHNVLIITSRTVN